MCLGSRRSIELDFLVLSAVWSCEERELLSPKRRRLEKNGAKGGDTERRSSGAPSPATSLFPFLSRVETTGTCMKVEPQIIPSNLRSTTGDLKATFGRSKQSPRGSISPLAKYRQEVSLLLSHTLTKSLPRNCILKFFRAIS